MANLFDKNPVMKMLKKAQTISASKVFVEVISDKGVQEFIVKLNTDQLKNQYIDSKGVKLSDIGGEYSDFTVAGGGKSSKFNVDLYDSGDFHKSFRVENISGDGFSIVSDPIKSDGTNLLEEWGEDVEGLTFESLDKLALFLLVLYQQKVLKILLG